MSDEPRPPRGPATEAIEELVEAQRTQNAILAALLNEVQTLSVQRFNPDAGVTCAGTESYIDDMRFTLYEED